jgi:PAS domain S-box-containing protein
MKSAAEGIFEKEHPSILLSALDFVPTGHLVLDHNFMIVFWNRCIESWTQIDREKVLHTSLFQNFAHLDKPKYRERIAGVFKGGPPVVFSSQLHKYLLPSRLPNGNLRIQHTTVTSIPDPHSEKLLALISIQDVTNLTDALDTNRRTLHQVEAEVAERKRAERTLELTVEELKTALAEIESLRGMIPICASCKKIRDDKGYWTQLESYFRKHSIAEFSHSICPECIEKLYPE